MKKLIFASLCTIIFAGCDGDWLPQPLTSDPDMCTVYYKDGTVEEIPCYYVYIDTNQWYSGTRRTSSFSV